MTDKAKLCKREACKLAATHASGYCSPECEDWVELDGEPTKKSEHTPGPLVIGNDHKSLLSADKTHVIAEIDPSGVMTKPYRIVMVETLARAPEMQEEIERLKAGRTIRDEVVEDLTAQVEQLRHTLTEARDLISEMSEKTIGNKDGYDFVDYSLLDEINVTLKTTEPTP